LTTIIQMLVNPMLMQMGIVKPDNIFKLFSDYVRSQGQASDRYVSAPSPDANLPKLTAQDALSMILNGQMPNGLPVEGAQAHLELLEAMPEAWMASGFAAELLAKWKQTVMVRAKQEAQQAQMMQAVQQFQQTMGQMGGSMGAQEAPNQGASGAPMVSNNELTTETLPSSGGGGNPGGMA
jgi:hypothetical protein